MCGICGFTGAKQTDMPIVKRMCDVMAHRGPDGEGQYIADGVALGHRRLSLIDLAGGSQPIVRETAEHASAVSSPESGDGVITRGQVAMVYNGEIYNYKDLRGELEADGWKFATSSDTEVLLVAYLAWGEHLLARVRGMFAFAIWDARSKELFCARDFFGIKPFYYTQAGGHFVFASEIKSILEHPAYKRELNTEALDQYLSFQFSVLPETFFKGVYKLEPGHCMRVKADGSVKVSRYWTPKFAADPSRDLESTVNLIESTIADSVSYHNVADVEVGSFLSSGIDSSYLTADLAEQNSKHIHTFTVGFAEYSGERDEISWARELADELGIPNYSRTITEKDFWSSLKRVQWHMDEPSADPSAVALYFVDAEAAKHVKAVLSGEGADEFFGGYRIYQTPFSNSRLGWVPKPLLSGASSLLGKMGVRGANYLRRASESVDDWYYTNANGVAFGFEERERLLKHPTTHVTPQELVRPVYQSVDDLDEVTRMQALDINCWLVGDILLKTDKMSMAHSLESRVPFLDRRVWDVARTVPTSFRVTPEQTKVALRDAAMRHIPRDWAEKEKLGFPVPLKAWLRKDDCYKRVRAWLTDDVAEKFFHTDQLVKLLDEHKSGAKDNSRKIWIVAMFLMWYRIYFVDQRVPEKPQL